MLNPQYTLVAPNVQPPNVQHCPQCATFFWEICVLPRVTRVVSLLCNTQEQFQLQNDKNERKHGLNIVFEMIKLSSKTVFYYLYRKILPLFTINWPLFFKMDVKSLLFIKNFISIFCGQCPQCATLFWGVKVLHIGCIRCIIYYISPT